MTDRSDALRVEFDNGKYAIVEDHGRVMLLRHGELWENGPPFAKLFIAIAHEVDALRKRPTPPTEALELAREAESMARFYQERPAVDAEKRSPQMMEISVRECRDISLLLMKLAIALLARPTAPPRKWRASWSRSPVNGGGM